MNRPLSKSPTLTLENIMCCIFDIKPLDVAVYLTLLKNGPSKVSAIAELLNRDRSTIQRSMQNLIRAGLVRRKQVNLKKGGYFYRYEAIPFTEVREKILKTIEEWRDEVKRWIEAIDTGELEDYIQEYVKNRR
ncbi:MAG TPA: winged helix-turn-helix transcriptional regulator [Methanothermococcus okinawensis]|uniref:Winged helix-turn-helix transcriptional regulator n=1 Tax=Methanothermococcus okinawensis TaxID=155863 RepID=A0A832ZCI8_9EURY|nr:winged helix-turn-helix transcriptional regulator [Methanococcaceae archaeon]HIP84911.1 winged helix-turn-helix transcriptional regulator [Methanothermococcus okinawensis]HIP91158.1 winged helix-turn-helix transcriptional regulator [Methanothermococcus okinawensis]